MKIGIVNISIGNVGSVVEAFRFLRQDVTPVDDPKALNAFDLLVLAGVGNFKTSMAKLRDVGFADALEDATAKGKPLLGICLGMQLFARTGFEDGETAGFGWIPGTVEKIRSTREKVPHMGWNTVHATGSPLFADVDGESFYFMHSYHFVAAEPEHVIATTTYGENTLVAAVCKDNLFGLQFHPEKSQGCGIRVLKNLLETIA